MAQNVSSSKRKTILESEDEIFFLPRMSSIHIIDSYLRELSAQLLTAL